MIGTFLGGLESYITMQNLGKIVQREPGVGSKTWSLSLCFFLYHAPRPQCFREMGHSLKKTIVSRIIG